MKKIALLLFALLLPCQAALGEMDLTLAQAVVNAEYYLSLGEERIDDVAPDAGTPPAPNDPHAQPWDGIDEADGISLAVEDVEILLPGVLRVDKDGLCSLALRNPPGSGLCVLLDLRTADGVLLVRTGAVPEGHQLSSCSLSAQALDQIGEDKNGRLSVYAYDAQTFESVAVTTLELDWLFE